MGSNILVAGSHADNLGYQCDWWTIRWQGFRGNGNTTEHFLEEAVIVDGGYTPSKANIIVFSTVHPYGISLSDSDKKKLPHLLRWMDYIQSTHDLG
ncbi:aminoacyl tRNA synthase complex-interacting multifunctional protein 1 [Tanacetum coccineum]